PYSFWEGMAARLVDSQAPGLARMVRDCAGIPSTGEGWQERMLDRLGRIYLLVEATRRLESLPEELQNDIKTAVGYTASQDEVLKQEGIADKWDIVGQRVEQDERLRAQRTWLWGRESRRWALVLSFAYQGAMVLDATLTPGTTIEGELVFFPSSFP